TYALIVTGAGADATGKRLNTFSLYPEYEAEGSARCELATPFASCSERANEETLAIALLNGCGTRNNHVVVIGRQHVDALGGQGQRVLDVGAGQAVLGHDGPVITQRLGVGPAHVDHRFDCQHQTLFQPEVVLLDLLVHEVRHLRRLVHDPADAVADIVLHDAEP